MSWKRARKNDLSALHSFLLEWEWKSVAFSSRLKKQEEACLPARRDAVIYLNRDKSRITGALLYTASGLILPLFSHSLANCRQIFPELKRVLPYSILGTLRDVGWVDRMLPVRSKISITYHLMTLIREDYLPVESPLPQSIPGLRLRAARSEDVQALFPLQKDYELEEVVISPDHFHDRTCFLNLKRLLRTQLVLIAEIDGKAVAKAGTNARGFQVDQIGGVYTIKSERRRGIGFWVMQALLSRLFQTKKMAALFVKQNNFPALGLYRKLGFTISDSYRIGYFQI